MSYYINIMLRNCFQPKRLITSMRTIHTSRVQYLYAPSAIGIDGYLQARKKVKEQFATYADKFRTKMQEFVSDDKNMIFTEDLKNMVHLAEPSDVELICNMIKKFNAQNTEFRFGSFVFGPVAMRMFHFLDAPNEALKCFDDSVNNGFFDQLVSYQILLDLLYNNEMYEEMFKVFDRVQERQINMTKYPKYPVVLILAACYKQNTPKSMEYASKLWTEMTTVGSNPLRRAATFFAALAMKQGAPHVALEVLSNVKPHYITVRNIKAACLAEAGRIEDALTVLKGVMQIDSPEQKDKHTFFEETISKVSQALDKTNDKDLKKEFEDIEKALRDRKLIDNQTIDQLLNAEIRSNRPNQDQIRGQRPFQTRVPFGQRPVRTKNFQ